MARGLKGTELAERMGGPAQETGGFGFEDLMIAPVNAFADMALGASGRTPVAPAPDASVASLLRRPSQGGPSSGPG
jgi:hypothetical protein